MRLLCWSEWDQIFFGVLVLSGPCRHSNVPARRLTRPCHPELVQQGSDGVSGNSSTAPLVLSPLIILTHGSQTLFREGWKWSRWKGVKTVFGFVEGVWCVWGGRGVGGVLSPRTSFMSFRDDRAHPNRDTNTLWAQEGGIHFANLTRFSFPLLSCFTSNLCLVWCLNQKLCFVLLFFVLFCFALFFFLAANRAEINLVLRNRAASPMQSRSYV